jgi:serine/threonine protein kinase
MEFLYWRAKIEFLYWRAKIEFLCWRAQLEFVWLQEYCNGGSLREAIQKGLFTSKRLPNRFAVIMTLLCHIADGIQYMHSKRICHGDLNPSNVLLKVRTPAPSRSFPRSCSACCSSRSAAPPSATLA